MYKIDIRSIEWLITENCNFTCEYCALYNDTKAETDMEKIKPFLYKIKQKQKLFNFTFFIFGGEPFLHPKVGEIIQEMNDLGIDYIFQTNLSNKSTNRIIEVSKTVDIQKMNISVHFTQQSVNTYVDNIKKVQNLVPITSVDVMYDSLAVLPQYREMVKKLPDTELTLCAVSDFLVKGFDKAITSFNSLRNNKEYNDIIFEDEVIEHPLTKEIIQRSYIWQEFTDEKWSPKGEVCILKDKFLMYDSQLGEFNCCFHDSIDAPYICPYDECFLS